MNTDDFILTDAVSKYRGLGLAVIPVGRDKKALVKWKGGAHPARCDAVWKQNPQANIAVLLGERSGGLCARDFDNEQAYHSWAERHPDLAATLPTSKTSRG